MRTLSLYQEFDVAVYESETWSLPPHDHSFFEIVYVLEGKGTHILNRNGYGYSKGSLFFLTPSDVHSFEISEKTRLCIITFNKIYFSKERGKHRETVDFSELFRKIELILNNAGYLQGEAIKTASDKTMISLLIERLLKEHEEKLFLHEAIIQNIIFMILNLIARNIQRQLTATITVNGQQNQIQEVIFYIQQHIYDKEKLKADAIAAHFNRSKNYISEFFKAGTGTTLRDYIQQYKLNLVKSRLQFSDMTIAQIADELGFTDESHLNKMFKLSYKMTAKEFKKQSAGNKLAQMAGSK